jgi:hypothetical protein
MKHQNSCGFRWGKLVHQLLGVVTFAYDLFYDEHVLLYPKGSIVTLVKVIGIRHEKLYKLMFQLARALMHSTNNSELCDLWHKRMGHFHHGAMRILREIVIGVVEFNIEHQEVCKGCSLGKYAKISFLSSDIRVEGILDLIHIDVCGPMYSSSSSGFLYYVTFIDNFSRKSWI